MSKLSIDKLLNLTLFTFLFSSGLSMYFYVVSWSFSGTVSNFFTIVCVVSAIPAFLIVVMSIALCYVVR